MTHYSRPAWLAITVGVAATGGALAILLADPVTTGIWRLDHVLLPVVVAITIAAGHLCGSALRGWRILPAMGFALIFAVGTALTVYSSVGAQKSGAGARQATEVAFHNGAIEEKRAEIEHARVRARQAQAMADKEMTGERCGARCKDWRLREQEVQARIAKLEGELHGLGAPQVAPSRARPFAEALGVVSGLDVAKVEKIATTFEPFAFSLLFELTAIVAFGFGFGGKPGRREPKAASPPQASDTSGKVVPMTTAPKVKPVQAITERDFETDPITDDELAELRRIVGTGGVNNRTLASRMGCSEGQASKLVTAAVAAGKVSRTKAGREVRIAALH